MQKCCLKSDLRINGRESQGGCSSEIYADPVDILGGSTVDRDWEGLRMISIIATLALYMMIEVLERCLGIDVF